VHNNRLIDALIRQAFSALNASPGARGLLRPPTRPGATYNNAALRQLANRFVDILHGCFKTGSLYDEAIAWSHHLSKAAV